MASHTSRSVSISRAPALLKLLILLVTFATCALSVPNVVVDLSYQHHLGADAVVRSVEEALRSAAADRGGSKVEIDVTSTLIGDEGCEDLARVFRACRDNLPARPGDPPTEVTLSACMNRISAAGASALLDAVADIGRKERAGQNSTQENADSSASAVEGNENHGGTSNESNPTTSAADETIGEGESERSCPLYISAIDLGLNDLGQHHRHGIGTSGTSRSLSKSIRTLIDGSCGSSPSRNSPSAGACPKVLRFDRCGLGPSACRAIGKGLIESSTSSQLRRLERLHLSGNDLIGDSGAAALAAALRTAPRSASIDSGSKRQVRAPLLKVLDLSSCGIGDAGAEALAMAIKDNPGCVKQLDLSHNLITDDGAIAIGRSLIPKRPRRRDTKEMGFVMERLDLSGNKDLGDDGAAALAEAMECGVLRSTYVRSCSVRSDGAAAFGKALFMLSRLQLQIEEGKRGPATINIDLSGNELGTLRTKAKSKPYSASLLKSKASATTASYMNFIGKKIKSGLKDAGLDQVVGNFVPSSESDDDEEEMMGLDEQEDQKSSTARCGARSFAEAFLNGDTKGANKKQSREDDDKRCAGEGIKYIIGMRQTSLDEGAADALGALVVEGRNKFGIDVSVDTKLSDSLGQDFISALQGSKEGEVLLQNMAKRHLDAVEALRIARQRAAEAVEAAAARARAEEMMSSAFGGPADDSDFGSIFSGESQGDYDFDEYAY